MVWFEFRWPRSFRAMLPRLQSGWRMLGMSTARCSWVSWQQKKDMGLKEWQAVSSTLAPLLYIDRDCCSGLTQAMFSGWEGLQIHLDIWHFMHQISNGCSTDSHQLYKLFMGRLSQCIFHWDRGDLELLKAAKHAEMEVKGIHDSHGHHSPRASLPLLTFHSQYGWHHCKHSAAAGNVWQWAGPWHSWCPALWRHQDLGRMAESQTPCCLPAGFCWCRAVYQDWYHAQGRHSTECLPMCQRFYVTGVL